MACSSVPLPARLEAIVKRLLFVKVIAVVMFGMENVPVSAWSLLSNV